MPSGDEYARLVEHLVRDQQTALGDRVWQIADSVAGVHVTDGNSITLEGDDRDAVGRVADEFQTMFGANVEESLHTAAHDLEHAVEIPPFLERERALRGYTEYKRDQDWEMADELAEVTRQPKVWARLFGFETTEVSAAELDSAPVAERRGIPLDASDPVYEAWTDQKQAETGFKRATGHTWVTAEEIPEQLLAAAADDLVGPLTAAIDRFGPDRARLIVWLTHRC